MTNRAKTYPEYLKSPHWQRLSRRIRDRDNFTCRLCNATDCELHVHHSVYRGWYNEEDGDLVTLCATCHRVHHATQKVVKARRWAKVFRLARLVFEVL